MRTATFPRITRFALLIRATNPWITRFALLIRATNVHFMHKFIYDFCKNTSLTSIIKSDWGIAEQNKA